MGVLIPLFSKYNINQFVGLFGLGVYLLILLIRLAKRGIQLLDLQIAERQRV
ncbi:hypothetical protein [Paenibacillus terrigena]|uniref:hypothetical protein n=1 Tax=Paenibacillus terrigena TaxID=369333 RepID=UPI00036B8EF8|nr:hypothetical protein [Paenibacillus terrigena]